MKDITKTLRFYDSQQLLGCQLCVCPMGSPPLVDLAMGVKGWVRQEPVTPSTAFNLLDISKLVASRQKTAWKR